MGQQVTKDIRSRLEHCTLEELLTDDKFIEELQRHLPGLPKRSQNKLAKFLASWENTPSKDSNPGSQLSPPRKERNSRAYQLASLWSIKSEDISIPQSVAETLKQNYCSLLCRPSKNGTDLQSPADHYEYTCAVDTGRTLDRILWRFLTTFYYDFISELDATKRRFSTVENGGLDFVVAVICQSGKHSPEVVREKVVGWIKVGRRYRGFMDALCTGCLILFPEQIGDLVWEKYVPIKGDTFAKVVQFLDDLGMVDKCEEEGWNDLSDKILQILRKPFRCLIAFQFQPGQQSQIGVVANSSLAPVAGDADIHGSERSILGHERVEIQDMDLDNPPSSRTLDSRALPRPVANRVIKTKRKKGTTSVRRQRQSFARDLTAQQTPRPEKSLPMVIRQSHHASRAHRSETQHETHGRDPQGRFPRAPTQCWGSAPNDPGQWHLATNCQDDRLLSPSVSINDRGRDPLSDISLNAPNVYPSGTDSAQYTQDVAPGSHQRFVSPPGSQVHGHCHMDQGQKTRESISDILRLERTGISTISALLNYDNNTSAIAFATTKYSLSGSENCRTEPVPAVAGHQSLDKAPTSDTETEVDSFPVPRKVMKLIKFDKHILYQILFNRGLDSPSTQRTTNILGTIWFGKLRNRPPFVSLSLPSILGTIVKSSGQEIDMFDTTGTCSTVLPISLIKLERFMQLIQRDGFGDILWNDYGDVAFVTIYVIDNELIADFGQSGISSK